MLNKSFVELLNFKHKSCIFNNSIEEDIPYNYINLYVKITDNCNIKCGFCEYHNKDLNFVFNLPKFRYLIEKLTKENIHIHKVSFTGGEPTLAYNILFNCIDILKELQYKPFIVVNSNGNNLVHLATEPCIDSISLSRHAVKDTDCTRIANGKIKLANDIRSIIKKTKCSNVHLTCSLIKGYVQDEKSVLDYLEFALSLGVHDVGFVSLMKINTFCEEHHIDFDDISFSTQQVVCNKEWSYKDVCKCKNFLYLPKKGNKVVKFYSRYRCKNEADSESNYVFDGEHLRSNFGGKIIII